MHFSCRFLVGPFSVLFCIFVLSVNLGTLAAYWRGVVKQTQPVKVVSMGDKTLANLKWDPYKLMNVTEDELRAVADRKRMRDELKAKWQRMSTSPHAAGRGGHHLDPGLQRWLSARAKAGDHFRVTTKTTIPFLLMVVLPIGGFAYALYNYRMDFDQKCRRGEIKPRDRIYKYMY